MYLKLFILPLALVSTPIVAPIAMQTHSLKAPQATPFTCQYDDERIAGWGGTNGTLKFSGNVENGVEMSDSNFNTGSGDWWGGELKPEATIVNDSITYKIVTIAGFGKMSGSGGTVTLLDLSNCTYLTRLRKGDSSEPGCFQNCRSLTTIILPKSLNKIDNMSFGYCSGITDIYFDDSSTPQNVEVGWEALSETTQSISIHVSKESFDAWTASGIDWGNTNAQYVGDVLPPTPSPSNNDNSKLPLYLGLGLGLPLGLAALGLICFAYIKYRNSKEDIVTLRKDN